MKQFKVLAKLVIYSEIIIEANTAEEAEAIAGGKDGGEFIQTDSGYFEVCKGEAVELISKQ